MKRSTLLLVNLLKQKHDILILDREPSKIDDVNFITCDLLESEKISNVLKDTDIVIHLAAAVGVKITEEDPLRTLNLNIKGTQNILESCQKNNVKKIILASSSEIYGEAVHIPINNNVAIKLMNANLGLPNSFSKNFSIIYISMIHQDLLKDIK